MIIDNKQVFWKMQHCFALIPIVQLLDGRILFNKKKMSCSPQKEKSNNLANYNQSKYSISALQ